MPGLYYPFVANLLQARDAPGGNILEIGCGAMQYRSLFRGCYAGLDLPGSRYLERQPEFLCGAEAIPAAPETYDLVFAVAVFVHLPDVAAVLKECRRVLRRGGRLLILDYDSNVGRRLTKTATVHMNVWGFEELRDRLVAAGFEAGAIHRVPKPYAPSLTPAYARFPLNAVRRLVHLFTRNDWLIVEATK